MQVANKMPLEVFVQGVTDLLRDQMFSDVEQEDRTCSSGPGLALTEGRQDAASFSAGHGDT